METVSANFQQQTTSHHLLVAMATDTHRRFFFQNDQQIFFFQIIAGRPVRNSNGAHILAVTPVEE